MGDCLRGFYANRKALLRNKKRTGLIDRHSRAKVPAKSTSSSEKPAVPWHIWSNLTSKGRCRAAEYRRLTGYGVERRGILVPGAVSHCRAIVAIGWSWKSHTGHAKRRKDLSIALRAHPSNPSRQSRLPEHECREQPRASTPAPASNQEYADTFSKLEIRVANEFDLRIGGISTWRCTKHRRYRIKVSFSFANLQKYL